MDYIDLYCDNPDQKATSLSLSLGLGRPFCPNNFYVRLHYYSAANILDDIFHRTFFPICLELLPESKTYESRSHYSTFHKLPVHGFLVVQGFAWCYGMFTLHGNRNGQVQ